MLIVAAASARSLAESALHAGFRVLCADCFEDQDLKDLLHQRGGSYIGRLTAFADLPELLEAIPAGIPLLWSGGLENHTPLLQHIAQHRPLAGLPLSAVDALRDSQMLSAALSQNDRVRFPEFLCGALPASGRWLWKARSSGGGLGVRFLNRNLRTQLAQQADLMNGCFQRELYGLPCSAIIHSEGQHVQLVGMSLQWCGWNELHAERFRFCGNFGPLPAPPQLAAAIREAAEQIATAAGCPNGLWGIDLLLTSARCWLLEVNPRIPASHWIYETQGGWNAVSCLVRNSGPSVCSMSARPRTHAPNQLRTQLIVWSSTNRPAPDLTALAGDLPADIYPADLPAAGSCVSAGSPICSLLCRTADYPRLRQAIIDIPEKFSAALDLSPTRLAAAIERHWQAWQVLARAWAER
jgi:predicted ATP-grasp superfamily ATP-dependent carboligase